MLRILLNALPLLAALATAQTTSIIYPTTAAPSATIVPGLHDYQYAGCWNETTGIPGSGGLRALNNGNTVIRHPFRISSHLNEFLADGK